MKRKYILILFFILTLAAFLRLWKISSLPPGIYPDEAMNANDALLFENKLFYQENNGREGLFMNLISLSFYLLGVSVFSFKIVPAIFGILTVLGVFLLAKELFDSWETGLLSSFFTAVSFWHINFSRIGFRAIMMPCVLAFSFYFLFKGFKQKNLLSFIVGGIIYGIGFHTYISFRLSVLLLAIILFSFLIQFLKEKKLKQYLLFSSSFLFSTFLVALPIGIYFLQNPQDFVSRATGVSVFSQPSVLQALLRSTVLHLGMFNFYGDPNWRHNFAGSPQLFWPVGIFFLIGLIFVLKKGFTSLKGKKYSEFSIYLLLVGGLFTLLLPGLLTYEGIPHALRAIGVIPFAYILAAFGGLKVYEILSKKINAKALTIISLALLVFIGVHESYKYFFNWAKRQELNQAFEIRYNEMGRYLNSLPSNVQAYVVVNEKNSPLYGVSIPGQTLMFTERTKYSKVRANYIKFEDIDNMITVDGKRKEIIALYEDNVFENLIETFPHGKVSETQYFKIFRID